MRVPLLALLLLTLASSQKNKDGDEGRPYEFGFTIDGQQHRHEKKDSNGIIQGEFGFITADGVYHVTVYATDENGNFKILSMKNIRISAPLDGSPATGPISPEAGKYLGKQNQAAPPTQSPQQFEKLQQPPAVPTPKAVTPFQGFTTQPTIRPACAGCGYVKLVPGQQFGLQTTVPPQGPQPVGPQIANRFGQGESLDLIRPPDAEIIPQVPGSTGGQSIPITQNVGGPSLPNANVQVQIQGQPNVQLQHNQPPQLQGQQPNAQYQQNLPPQLQGQPPNAQYQQNLPPQLQGQQPNAQYQQNLPPQLQGQKPTAQYQQNYPVGPNQVLNIQQTLPVGPNQVSNVKNSVQYTAGVNQGGIQLPNGQSTPDIGLNLPGQNGGFVESVNGNRGIDPSIQSEQISALPPISVKENVIHVGGANPQDISIKDKYPGMVNGLPEGIEEKDITNILYKFKYTVGFHGHWERGLKNGAKIGGYFVNGRDGISRIVTYIADENGYRPKFKLVNLGLDSDETPKEGSEKKFGLKDFEFVWYPVE